MNRISFLGLLGLLALLGCGKKDKAGNTTTPAGPVPGPVATGPAADGPEPAAGRPAGGGPAATLADARKGFRTRLPKRPATPEPVTQPPPKVFRLVKYDAPPGKLSAYLTPDPGDGKKRPAVVWVTGGDCNSIDEGCWKKGPPANDQSASAFREAGFVMMFPSLRGGNDNPGAREGFFGEVDDVLAAADYLAAQPHVDPARIYLGGHSTGGTLVLLVAEYTDRFRAVFSFGPVDDPSGYGPEYTPFDTSNPKEVELRSPGRWLAGIKSPTFVIEGAREGNVDSLQKMARASANPKAQFFPVPGATHFSVLGPVNKVLAQKILADTGPECRVTITPEELNKLFRR